MVRVSKKVKFLVCLLIGFFLFVNKVNASVNPYNKIQTIDKVTTVSCTWLAWQEVYEKTGIELPRWGNAVNWYERASKMGYKVGNVAKPNSIAVWKNSNNIYGHVAYVVSVNGDKMTINEGGITTIKRDDITDEIKLIPFNGDGVYYNNVISLSLNRNENSVLLGFIYLTNEENSFTAEIVGKERSSQENIESVENKSESSTENLNVKKKNVLKVNKNNKKIAEDSTIAKENEGNKETEEIIDNKENKILTNKEMVNNSMLKNKKKNIITRYLIAIVLFLIIVTIILFCKFIKIVILKPLYLWYNLN